MLQTFVQKQQRKLLTNKQNIAICYVRDRQLHIYVVQIHKWHVNYNAVM